MTENMKVWNNFRTVETEVNEIDIHSEPLQNRQIVHFKKILLHLSEGKEHRLKKLAIWNVAMTFLIKVKLNRNEMIQGMSLHDTIRHFPHLS